MAGEPKTLVYPLAILAGVAAGFQPFDLPSASGLVHYAATQVVRATELEKPGRGPTATAYREPLEDPAARKAAVARLGAESAELRALRRAEADLFPDEEPLDFSDSPPEVIPPSMCESPAAERTESLFRQPGDWLRGLNAPEIRVQRSPVVAKYVRFFTANPEGRKMFESWLRRSGRYRTLIGDELAKRELPRDLVAVPFIESGMWPTAVSSAGAVGLWQFMPKTARAYGLTVERGFDERRNIFASTRAAVEHLKDLYERFDSWELALAAYNAGYARVDAAMQTSGFDDFWALVRMDGSLPRETQLYVPKILAVMVILNNLGYFGFGDVEYQRPIHASEIEVPGGIRLSLLARAAGTSVQELKELNPHLVSEFTPRRNEAVYLHVPSSGVARARVLLPKLLSDETDIDARVSSRFDWGKDDFDGRGRNRLERAGSDGSDLISALRSGRGESFFDAAPGSDADASEALLAQGREREAREPEESLAERLRAARTEPAEPEPASGLRVFAPKAEEKPSEAGPPAPAAESAPAFEHYVVRRGDTLSEISAAYGVSDDELRALNGLGPRSQLYVGQTLKVRAPKTVDFYYHVARGDTVSEIAHQFSTNVHMIQRDNRLRNPSVLPVGRTLRLRLPEPAKSD